ncbi:MAG: phosphotransferase [Anaerolineae bacterium]
MLSPADAQFARRDPDLPGLALILDPDAFAGALRTALSATDVGEAQAVYVRYKPRTNCLVSYRLNMADAEVNIYAKAFRPDAGDKLNKARRRSGRNGTLKPGTVVLDEAVVVYAFPHDRKLDTLAHLADEGMRRRLLAHLLPDRPELWEAALIDLHYKPERRYVARLATDNGAAALLKVYAADGFNAASNNARAFASRGPLQLPQRLGRSNRYRALALQWLPGRPLTEAAREPAFDLGVMDQIGAALAELHRQNPKRLAYRSREIEAAALMSAAVGVAAVYPNLSERAFNLAKELCVELLQAPRLDCPIHGDFSSDQVLVGEKGVAILDLDRSARSDPAADLGSFVARIEYDTLTGDLPFCRATALTDSLLEGYRRATRGNLPPRIGLYIAAGLLRLAPLPFRSRDPAWLIRTLAVLERAEEIANYG